jgi:hypothetical protein
MLGTEKIIASLNSTCYKCIIIFIYIIMNKYTIFFALIIVIITVYEFKDNLFEGFSSSSDTVKSCPKCQVCPKLQLLNAHTFMTAQ